MTNKHLDSIWKDLSVWKKEIDIKDEALTRRKAVHDKALPPVRPSTELILDNLKPVGLDSLETKKSVTTTTKSNQSRTEKAEAEKAKGNDCFGKKDFKNAIAFYGKAIDLDPTVPVYFVNRAMAYLKINRFLEAEKDCTRGIQLQPKNVKALWRRGIALRELGRFNEARKDFETGLSIDPNNKSILDELKKLPAAQKSTEKSKVKTDAANEPYVEPMRRLPIKVVDEAYSDMKPISTAKVQEIKASPVTAPSSPPSSSSTPKPTPRQKNTVTPAQKPTAVPTQKPAATPTQKPIASALKFTCPRTNFEFERDWKTYKGRGDDILYQYFQCIPPSSYATLFKSSLESDQFEKMIDMLESRYVKEKSAQEVFNVLEGLSQVKRIDMLIMFLSKKHQQDIQGLFNAIKDSDIDKEKLKKIAKVYGITV